LRISSRWQKSPTWRIRRCANSAMRIVKRFKSKDQPLTTSRRCRLPGLRLRQAVLALYVPAQRSVVSALPIALSRQLDGLLEPRGFCFASASNTFVFKTRRTVACGLILRFSRRRMPQPNKTDSKLCASRTRHAIIRRPMAVADGSTCKGGSAPRCIPRQRAWEAWSHA
jgi:hypothetical protein